MRKTSVCLATIIMIVVFALSLSACYNSAHPASMSQLVGTYELMTYRIGTPKSEAEMSQKQSEDESNFNYTDRILAKKITCYLIVRDDGTGYYVYGDEETPLYAQEVRIFYSYNEEQADKVKEIRYTAGTPHKDDDYPGCGEEPLGVNAKTKTLNYYLGTYTFGKLSRKYTQQVTYKKVDKATDLSYVQKKLDRTFDPAPFILNGLDGFFTAGITYFDEGSDYIYYGIDLKSVEGKADVYYALKSNKQQVVVRDQVFSYTIKETEDEYNGQMTLTIGDDNNYIASYSKAGAYYSNTAIYAPHSFSWELRDTDENGTDIIVQSKWYSKQSDSADIEKHIADMLADYEEYLNPGENA